MKTGLKRFLYLILGVFFLLILINYKLVWYGLSQARGQIEIIRQAKSIEATLLDPDFPDSLKANLRLVEEIKRYAIDSLGLKPTDNYSTVYNQQGKEVLWVVSACDPYEFKPKSWSFPLIGSFTYKGFFAFDKAKSLAGQLKEEGLDIYVRSVSGWSTLGWFKDPILSNMLAESPGELANTIIHELTHGTIFIPDSMTFNENLATFIGNRGAERFLENKYGRDSQVYMDYVLDLEDSQLFTQYVITSAGRLDSLYQTLLAYPDSIRLAKKTQFIDDFVSGLKVIEFKRNDWYTKIYDQYRPNNAYFISFLSYRARQSEFNELYYKELDSDLDSFIRYWKKSYSR